MRKPRPSPRRRIAVAIFPRYSADSLSSSAVQKSVSPLGVMVKVATDSPSSWSSRVSRRSTASAIRVLNARPMLHWSLPRSWSHCLRSSSSAMTSGRSAGSAQCMTYGLLTSRPHGLRALEKDHVFRSDKNVDRMAHGLVVLGVARLPVDCDRCAWSQFEP